MAPRFSGYDPTGATARHRRRERARRFEQRWGVPHAIEYRRPWLYKKQEDALFHPARYVVVEASTKTGKTVGCIIWLTEQACLNGKPGQHYWWVAPTYRQAEIAYGRLKRYLPQGLFHSDDGDLRITLINGAVLEFKTGVDPDRLYGEDVYAAVIDEATRCRDTVWHAVRSTLTATQGPVRIIGNVKGRKNWAFQLARRAESGEPNMHYAKLTIFDAVEAGVVPPSEIDDARRTLPEHVFNELYLAIPSEDGSNPFGLDAIQRCVEYQGTGSAVFTGEPIVAWGIDLARSVDWTVAVGLGKSGRVTGFARWQSPWKETLTRIPALVGKVPTLIDATGVGDPVVELLSRAKPNISGFTFTSPSKQALLESLAVHVQHTQVGVLDNVLRAEMEAFEYEVKNHRVYYSAPDGMHDDCVMAMSLAVKQFATPQPDVFVPVAGPIYSPYEN